MSRLELMSFYSRCYLCFALPLIIFISLQQPAFYSPDEASHFIRAYQITEGDLFLIKSELEEGSGLYSVGSEVDPNILKLNDEALKFYTDRSARMDANRADTFASFQWGEPVWVSTENVAIYPPFLYFPQAISIGLGRYLDLSIERTVHLARLCNGIISMIVAMIAIAVANRGRGFLLLLLLMPMTLAQFSSVGQDALIISIAALAAALFTRLNEKQSTTSWVYMLVICCLLFLISASRPPYIALSMFFLVYAIMDRQIKAKRDLYVLFFIISFFLVVAWSAYISYFVSVGFGPEGVNYKAQLVGVIYAPFTWLGILGHTISENYFFYIASFLGNLGYLDTPLPFTYYVYSVLIFLLIFAWSWLKVDFEKVSFSSVYPFILNLLVIVATIVSVFLVLYVSWTPVSAGYISGVQGRYLIPIAFFAILLSAEQIGLREPYSNLLKDRRLELILLISAIINCMTITWAIAVRYY